jgi:hypothetical protein
MSFPPRLVAFFCFLQTICIIIGFFVTRFSASVFDRFNMAIPAPLQHVRFYGYWYLLVPLVWGVLTVGQARTDDGSPSISGRQLIIGVAITAVLVFAFLASAVTSLCLLFGHHGSLRV